MNFQMSLICPWCDEPIVQGDELAKYLIGTQDGPRLQHYECSMRSVIGGLNHLKGCCTCCGGKEPPDPADLSKRAAAQAAFTFWRLTKRS